MARFLDFITRVIVMRVMAGVKKGPGIFARCRGVASVVAARQDDASDDTRLRIAAGCIQMAVATTGTFSTNICSCPRASTSLHSTHLERVIGVPGNVDSQTEHGFLRPNLGPRNYLIDHRVAPAAASRAQSRADRYASSRTHRSR